MVYRLLSEWCVASSFYQSSANHVSFYLFSNLRNLLYLIISSIFSFKYLRQAIRAANALWKRKAQTTSGLFGCISLGCTILVATMWLEHMTLQVWMHVGMELRHLPKPKPLETSGFPVRCLCVSEFQSGLYSMLMMNGWWTAAGQMRLIYSSIARMNLSALSICFSVYEQFQSRKR